MADLDAGEHDPAAENIASPRVVGAGCAQGAAA
jgi:hypothetical protein